jgi:hypothetical protein
MTATELGIVDERGVGFSPWRPCELLKGGCEPDDAVVLTTHAEGVLYLALALPGGGSPQAAAVRILP